MPSKIKLREFVSSTINKYLCEAIAPYDIKLNGNFDRWFGNSKIVEGGKPMICYHGSPNANIEVFDISKIGRTTGNYGHYGYGIYFSTDIREAKIYGDNIYECFIKIEKPFYGSDDQLLELKNIGIEEIDDLEVKSIDFESFKNSFKNDVDIFEFLENIEKHGVEYAWDVIHKINKAIDLDMMNDISNIIDYTTLNKDVDGVPDYVLVELQDWGKEPKLNHGFPHSQSLHWITDLGNNSLEVTEAIKKLGYDGVVYWGEVVAFEPRQIKSINNSGTWGPEEDNIYF